MVFWKKKKMIDIREMQRQGRLRIVKPGHEPDTNAEGFVELSANTDTITPTTTTTSSESTTPTSTPTMTGDGFFGFMDNPASGSSMDASPSTSMSETGELRKISQQISDLDNKLYKMEQRIELLERKAGVGN